MNGTIITIDSNEHSHHPEHKTKFEEMGALCQVKSLDYDFRVICPDGAILAIERKTPRDFLDSIKDRRLFNQVGGLVAGGQWAYVVIEGLFLPYDGYAWVCGKEGYQHEQTNWSWHSLQGALLSIQEMGCAIVYDPDFHGAVKRLVNRSRGDVKIVPRRDGYVFSEQESTLMTLPGIGSKKAQAYLKQFGTLGNAIMQLCAESIASDIDGWGKKSAQKLHDYFGW